MATTTSSTGTHAAPLSVPLVADGGRENDNARSTSTTNTIQDIGNTPFTLITSTHSSATERPEIPRDHSCLESAYLMSQIHNTILRSLNAIHKHATLVSPSSSLQTVKDFLVFNQCAYEFLHYHHHNEDDDYFPALAQITGNPDFCKVESGEHELFNTGAEKWKQYIYNTEPEEYDGEKLKGLVEAFGPALQHHLVSEIQTILSLYKYDSEACKKAFEDTGKRAMGELDWYRHTPLILYCQGASHVLDGKSELFPPGIPSFMRYVVRYIYARRNRGAWRFAPSDEFGKPRPELVL